MTSVLTPQFLFRFAFPVLRDDRLPQRKPPLTLPPACRIADLSALSGLSSPVELSLVWNPRGIGLSLQFSGKLRPPRCNPDEPTSSDGLQVWFDTRCTQNVHRASQFCHFFCLLPSGGGAGDDPVGRQLPVPRAREDAPLCDASQIQIASKINPGGYALGAWLPAVVLNGFDPVAQPQLGFYFAIMDSELGLHPAAVGDEFPYASDPSLWMTLQLADA